MEKKSDIILELAFIMYYIDKCKNQNETWGQIVEDVLTGGVTDDSSTASGEVSTPCTAINDDPRKWGKETWTAAGNETSLLDPESPGEWGPLAPYVITVQEAFNTHDASVIEESWGFRKGLIESNHKDYMILANACYSALF